MSAPSLKEKLINKLRETDDPVFLQELSNLFELQEHETVYMLSKEENTSVEEALEEYKKGKYKNSDEADKEADEWLGK